MMCGFSWINETGSLALFADLGRVADYVEGAIEFVGVEVVD